MDVWRELERAGPESVAGLRRGTRVALRPRAQRDAWDAVLAGRTALVDRIEEDTDGVPHVVVTLPDDPAQQRFFFAVDEVEPLLGLRVLVAGVGNLFLGDDGFGCAVAAALADAPLPDGVDVEDYGVRGLDLAYALAAYDAAVLVDAVPLGEPPGTVALIEPQPGDEPADIETHGMDPARVLRLARQLGQLPPRVLVVGCEPGRVVAPESDEVVAELSPPVRNAVAPAAELVRSVVEDLLKGGER